MSGPQRRDGGTAQPSPAASSARPAPPRARFLTILAQDPAVRVPGTDRFIRAIVPVPSDVVRSGPRSSRFHVVDYDATGNELRPPTGLRYAPDEEIEHDPYADTADADLVASPAFRAQNVYAIAARTLGAFEAALGRRIPWSFSGHQLYLVPAAFREANAYYDGESNAVLFGYFDGPEGPPEGRVPGLIYTGLSHDIVAHETTHAVLDGLRSRLGEPGLPDQLAFHEAFADIVALLSVFSVRDLVEQALGPADADGRIGVTGVEPAALHENVLLGLAEQMGQATRAHSGSALRRSVDIEPFISWRDDLAYDEPHLRGEILVAAVMHAFVALWARRLSALVGPDGRLDRRRAAEEGRKSAEHLLRMVIRAIDYCPPLELEYDDFIEALLVSDGEVAPDDEHGYRPSIARTFAAFGIASRDRVVDLSAMGALDYGGLHVAELRDRADEMFRFLWQNAAAVGLQDAYYATVDDLVPSVRVGPDGFVLQEVVATYRQMLNGTAAEIGALSAGRLRIPAGLDPRTALQIHGGGTVVFDQFGRAKHQLAKPIFDWERQSARLDFLARNRILDRSGRVGFSTGAAQGQRFAVMHDPQLDPEEIW